MKEAGNTEEGGEFQRWEVEGKKPSLNRLILALESSIPVFTLDGKMKVSEEKAETVITEVHRQGHLGENKTWKAFNRKYSTPQGRKKCREVVRTCRMPAWQGL